MSDEALLDLAMQALGRGEAAAAAAHLDALLASAPGHAEAHHQRGVIALRLGDVPGALAHLERALEGLPTRAAVWHSLGLARQRAGRGQAALQAHLTALRLDRTAVERWHGLVETVAAQPDVPFELMPWLCEALDQPGVAGQRLERACRQLAQDDPVVAAALADRAVDRALLQALDLPLVHRWWRRTLVASPEWRRLLERLRRALVLTPDFDGHHTLACALASQALKARHWWSAQTDELAAVEHLDVTDPGCWPRWLAYNPLPAGLPRPQDPDLAALHDVAVAESRAT